MLRFQKCGSCEILPPAPAQFADSSPEEMNKVLIWPNDNILYQLLVSNLLFQSPDNVVVKVDMKMTRFWLLSCSTSKMGQRLKTLHLCSFLSELGYMHWLCYLFIHLLWIVVKIVVIQREDKRENKRGQMRGKFLRRRRRMCQHCFGWESQTSDMVSPFKYSGGCSKCLFVLLFSFGSTQHTTMKSNH